MYKAISQTELRLDQDPLGTCKPRRAELVKDGFAMAHSCKCPVDACAVPHRRIHCLQDIASRIATLLALKDDSVVLARPFTIDMMVVAVTVLPMSMPCLLSSAKGYYLQQKLH